MSSSTTRVELISAMLKAHGLADQYGPGAKLGPEFKMWWTGSGFVISYVSCLTQAHVVFVAAAEEGRVQ